MALPVIDNILNEDPETHIEVWCGRHSRPVFECHPGIRSIVDVPSVPSPADLPGLIRQLRASSNDGVLVLDRSRLIAAACKIAGAPVLGAVRSTSAEIEHETDRYLDALKQAGIEPAVRQPVVKFGAADIARVQKKIGVARKRYIVLHPGGAQNPGAEMLSKRWPQSHWIEVIEWLSSRSIDCILTGSQEEVNLCEGLASDTGVKIAAGRLSLIESAELIAGALAYVGPDTGLSHLAAATGTPTVVIFGPTNPRHYAPRGESVTILAAPGSCDLSSADLRKSQPAGLPSTSEVAVKSVIDALELFLDADGAQPC